MFCLWASGIASLASIWHGRDRWIMVGHVTFEPFFEEKRKPCIDYQDQLWAFALFCALPKFSHTWAHSCVNCSSIPPAREVLPARMCTNTISNTFCSCDASQGKKKLYEYILSLSLSQAPSICPYGYMIYDFISVLYHLYIHAVKNTACLWPKHLCTKSSHYPSLSRISTPVMEFSSNEDQFHIVQAETVTFSFCQASGRHVMPKATWSTAKDPRQILESWSILTNAIVRRSQAQGKKGSKAQDRNLMKFVVAAVLCSELCATVWDGVEWRQACVYQCQPTLATGHRDSPRASPSRTETNRWNGKSEQTLDLLGPWWPWMAMEQWRLIMGTLAEFSSGFCCHAGRPWMEDSRLSRHVKTLMTTDYNSRNIEVLTVMFWTYRKWTGYLPLPNQCCFDVPHHHLGSAIKRQYQKIER